MMNMDICILVTGEKEVGKTELIDSFARSSIIVSGFFITFIELWDFITLFFQDETKSGICRLRVKNTLVTFHIEESLFCLKIECSQYSRNYFPNRDSVARICD